MGKRNPQLSITILLSLAVVGAVAEANPASRNPFQRLDADGHEERLLENHPVISHSLQQLRLVAIHSVDNQLEAIFEGPKQTLVRVRAGSQIGGQEVHVTHIEQHQVHIGIASSQDTTQAKTQQILPLLPVETQGRAEPP